MDMDIDTDADADDAGSLADPVGDAPSSSSSEIEPVARKIFEQHDEIRLGIRWLLRNAEHADLPSARHALRLLLARFIERFEAHLRYEEESLFPIVRAIDAWGEQREEAFILEHEAQRRRLDEVRQALDVPEDPEDASEVGDVIWALTESLLLDMAQEEETLRKLLGQESGSTDQFTG